MTGAGATPPGGGYAARGVDLSVVSGEATDEEAAAIVAAVEAAWPRPAAASGVPGHEPARWKFSGRWWTKPVPLRRERPGSYS